MHALCQHSVELITRVCLFGLVPSGKAVDECMGGSFWALYVRFLCQHHTVLITVPCKKLEVRKYVFSFSRLYWLFGFPWVSR